MKRLWKENRVMFMLVVILVICFVAIICVALTFFYSKNVSKYGNRLDGIEDHPIKTTVKSQFKEELQKNESVKKVKFTTEGRIIYINITFDSSIDVEKAKEIVNNSLSLFDEDLLSYYDIEFVLESDNFTIIGAKNSVIDHISWNNNREVVEETDEES